jgi:diguanylate cyclase (GGDEF)-like protein/PAS domain S-box-containing protein
MRIKKKSAVNGRTTAKSRRAPALPKVSARRYHDLLFALTEGVIMISSAGKVIVVNPSAEAILGIPFKDMDQALRDDDAWHAVTKDGKPFPPRNFPLRKTLRTRKPQSKVVVGIRRKGRTTRWTEVSTQLLYTKGSRVPAAVVASFEDVTRQRRVEAELAGLAAATQASPDAITSTNVEGKLVSWNPGAQRLFGYTAKEAIGRLAGWMLPEAKREELRGFRERVLKGETISGWETERLREDGQRIYFSSSYAPIRDARGHIIGTVGVHRDISHMKRMLMQIESSNELFRLALHGIPDVFLIYDAQLRIQFVNERGTEFYARNNADIVGRRDEDLLPPEVAQVFHPVLAQARDSRTTQSGELSFVLRGGRFSVTASYVPMVDDNGDIRQILGLLHDVTQRRQVEERLSFLAQYDALTGLPNRYLLLDRLDAAMQRARRNSTLLGVMFLDIDRFKQINDTHGHATGDVMLQQIAERLAGTLRATDTVARLGGDEFTVLVENATHVDEITSVADKIKQAFATPFTTSSGVVYTTTSVGITIFPFDDPDRDGLLKNADTAMYHAKQDRNAWMLYHSDMNANTAGRLNMEVELRHALARNEFELNFQPQLNIKSGKVVGLEALIRWNNPALGHVSPIDFIPLAEDTGLIVSIGDWILRSACEQCKAWEQAGLQPIPVSVNIAAAQFRRGNLLQLVSTVLAELDLDARWLALEITESNIMRHAEQTIKTLSELRELGVSIAIDDFGTGYSSLAYLKRFPVNKIKVDQSFVHDIGTDPNDAAIVSAIIAMSRQLGITALAEGVETEAQLAFLSGLECDEYQGYLFSKPVPASEIPALLGVRALRRAGSA